MIPQSKGWCLCEQEYIYVHKSVCGFFPLFAEMTGNT